MGGGGGGGEESGSDRESTVIADGDTGLCVALRATGDWESVCEQPEEEGGDSEAATVGTAVLEVEAEVERWRLGGGSGSVGGRVSRMTEADGNTNEFESCDDEWGSGGGAVCTAVWIGAVERALSSASSSSSREKKRRFLDGAVE